MNEQSFWAVIDASRAQAAGDPALGATVDNITKALAESYLPYLEQCRNKG